MPPSPPDDGVPQPVADLEAIAAQNRVAVPAMFAEHSERLTRLWEAASRPVAEDSVRVWLLLDRLGGVSGAGETLQKARRTALGSELLMVMNHDGALHAASVEALGTMLEDCARGLLPVRVHLSPDDIESYCESIDVRPGGRAHRLIESAVRAAAAA